MNIPEVTFKTRIGDNQNLGGGCSIGGKWKEISTQKLFENKSIRDIATSEVEWSYLYASGTQALTAGIQEYTVTTAASTIDWDSFVLVQNFLVFDLFL